MKRQELIEKWLEALESGRFKQARGNLSRDYGTAKARYCCLGVACVVAKENGMRVSDDTIQFGQMLPDNVAKKLGISSLGAFKVSINNSRGNLVESLAWMNDSGATFKTIVKTIREQLAAGNFVKP